MCMMENNNVYIDECGGLYTHDRKVLLKAPNIPRYQVREGTEHIAKDALMGCRNLIQICFPCTLHREDLEIVDLEMFVDDDGWTDPCIGHIVLCDKPYSDEDFPNGEWWRGTE